MTSELAPGVQTVRVVDIPQARVRRPVDLMQMILSLLGIIVVLALSFYARGTTSGVTDDVQSALSNFVRNVLLVPVSVIEGLLVIVLPAVVLTMALIRRKLRNVLEAVSAAGLAYFAAVGGSWFIMNSNQIRMRQAIQLWDDGAITTSIIPVLAALAALLTVSGTRAQNRAISASWPLLWVGLMLSIITGDGTIIGALITVFLGRAIGLGMRYASGMLADRAHGASLVAAITRAGAIPVSVVRIGEHTNTRDLRVQNPVLHATTPGYHPATSLVDVAQDEDTPPPENTQPTTGVLAIVASTPDPATVAVEREGWNRVYAVTTVDGRRYDAIVLDEDRQVIGLLSQLWTAVRLRGVGRRSATNLRQAAERAALMSYAAMSAGVSTPQLHGIAETPGSVVLLGEHINDTRPLADLPPGALTRETMVATWQQLRTAHGAGLSHRNISGDTVLVDSGGGIWLSEWQQGEIASSTLSLRIDQFQLLALFSFIVGVEDAIAAAREVLADSELAALAGLVQRVILPPDVQIMARSDRQVLRQLRVRLVELLPEGPDVVEPIKLTRFSARTAIMTTAAIVAGWVLLTTLNFADIVERISEANPVWLILAFASSQLTFVGAGIALYAFSPAKLRLWTTTLVQVAASVISLIVPAGVGPAAFNLRYMQKQKVDTPTSVTTVALLQISQIFTTVLLLITLALFTGRSGALKQLPSGTILVVIVAVLATVGVVVSIPAVRRWLASKIMPTLRQVWPQVLWVASQPMRLSLGIVGNLLVTAGYLFAFGFTAKAFDYDLSASTVAIVYLTGNTIGAAVPTPGGIGAVEGALSTGLRAAGVATAAALSISVIFRVITFWLRVPIGWVVWRHLQRNNQI